MDFNKWPTNRRHFQISKWSWFQYWKWRHHKQFWLKWQSNRWNYWKWKYIQGSGFRFLSTTVNPPLKIPERLSIIQLLQIIFVFVNFRHRGQHGLMWHHAPSAVVMELSFGKLSVATIQAYLEIHGKPISKLVEILFMETNEKWSDILLHLFNRTVCYSDLTYSDTLVRDV